MEAWLLKGNGLETGWRRLVPAYTFMYTYRIHSGAFAL